ncbi:MAG: terminase family protein [Bacteroidales bacterium]|nr:terminase family protein [Bacteroidales bacterium]
MTEVERKKEILKLMRKRARLLAPNDFAHFLAYANPKYQAEWFHQLIAHRCQDVLEGRIKNLMVFIPPQHGKSEIISRMFPAWALGRNPDLKIVSCSYSSDLSQQFSRSVQRIIDTKDYAEIFPDTFISGSMVAAAEVKGFVRNVDFFETVGHRGFYKAVGVGGSLTGTPVDIAIIDDPVKDAAEANSTTYRQRVWDWYNTVLSTRLHNESRQLFIMTRWHEDDLAGRILRAEPNEWQVLSIPAICEVERDNGLSRRKIGDALWPQRHSLEKLEKQKTRAPREFSALYQQRPTIEGGNIVKRDWFPRISLADFTALRFREPMHFYLDTAYNKRKKGQDNDPSGILAACRINNQIYVYKAQRVWKEMPDLLRFIPEFMGSNLGNEESILHVEPKANGISVVQMLHELSTLNVRQTPTPQDDKEVRLRVVSPRIETGRVTLVEGSWNDDFLDEVCGFPTQPHDEFVDILGYAINDLYHNGDDLSPDVDIDDLFSY